jgi:hypothetical protein
MECCTSLQRCLWSQQPTLAAGPVEGDQGAVSGVCLYESSRTDSDRIFLRTAVGSRPPTIPPIHPSVLKVYEAGPHTGIPARGYRGNRTGDMQDRANELQRTPLLRTRVNNLFGECARLRASVNRGCLYV